MHDGFAYEAAAKGLFNTSESDYPFETIYLKVPFSLEQELKDCLHILWMQNWKR
jgi:hypothetical protein